MLYYAGWKKILISIVILLGGLFVTPNFLQQESLDKWSEFLGGIFPNKQVVLGLDLQGGASLLLEVDTSALLKEKIEVLSSQILDEARESGISINERTETNEGVFVQLSDRGKNSSLISLLSARGLVITEDDKGFLVKFSEESWRSEVRVAVNQSIEIIRRRVDESGTKEPIIQRQGNDRILLQLPGVDNPEEIKKLLGTTAKLSFHIVDSTTYYNKNVASNQIILPSDSGGIYYILEKKPVVTGDNLKDANLAYDNNNYPAVGFNFNTVGAERFANATRKNVGKSLAIVLDGKVISAPNIQVPIVQGNGIITGNFTVKEASNLATLLRAGALPVPINVIEERSVGPGLGHDSIENGRESFVIALVFTCIVMFVLYGIFGLFANIALVINIMLIFAIMTAIQATLTLPGIAGVVLTIGMAVDGNVLIFERIREELGRGNPPISSISVGFGKAIGTILDSNITTLIVAAMLYQFGSGPVRGFAVTLAIGILCSLFTATMLTQWLVVSYFNRKKVKTIKL